jgi:hypothetical protein
MRFAERSEWISVDCISRLSEVDLTLTCGVGFGNTVGGPQIRRFRRPSNVRGFQQLRSLLMYDYESLFSMASADGFLEGSGFYRLVEYPFVSTDK